MRWYFENNNVLNCLALIPGRAVWAAPTGSSWWVVGSWWRRSVLLVWSVRSADSRCYWPSRWRPSSLGDCLWTVQDTSSWWVDRRTAWCWRGSRNRPGWWLCADDWDGRRSHRPYETSHREHSRPTWRGDPWRWSDERTKITGPVDEDSTTWLAVRQWSLRSLKTISSRQLTNNRSKW